MTKSKQLYLDFVDQYEAVRHVDSRHDFEGAKKVCPVAQQLFELMRTPQKVPLEFLRILPNAINTTGHHFKGSSRAFPQITENGHTLNQQEFSIILADNYYQVLNLNRETVLERRAEVAKLPETSGCKPLPEWMFALGYAPDNLFHSPLSQTRKANWLKDNAWVWNDPALFKPNGWVASTGIHFMRSFREGYEAENDALIVFEYPEVKTLLCHQKKDNNSAAALVHFSAEGAVSSAYCAMEGLGKEGLRTLHDFKGMTAEMLGVKPFEHEGMQQWAAELQPAIQQFQQKIISLNV